jgi:hypothetical protein
MDARRCALRPDCVKGFRTNLAESIIDAAHAVFGSHPGYRQRHCAGPSLTSLPKMRSACDLLREDAAEFLSQRRSTETKQVGRCRLIPFGF